MRDIARLGVLAAIVVAITTVTDDRFWLRVITLTLIWAAAGMSWNLVAKAGQISLAHGAFFGIGAYTFTILVGREPAISPWIGMLVGMVLAAALAVIIGLPTFRLKGFYFTLATLSFPLMLMLLVSHFGKPEMTIPYRPDGGWAFLEFRDARMYIWILLAMLVLYLAITIVIDRSPFGLALAATRDNEVLARAVGVRSGTWKLAAFAISAAMSAAVAVLWVKSVLRVTTAEETFSTSIVIVMLSVAAVGGVGRTWAPVLGATILTPLAMWLDRSLGASIAGVEELVYGVALVLVALLAPDGVLSLGDRFAALRSRPRLTFGGRRSAAPARTGHRGDAVLTVDSIAKRFGQVTVLHDVGFTVTAGERLGLIGPNGAGKTTLFNILTGHLAADAGVVRFAGADIAGMSAPARFGAGIARTFQVPQGFHRMTVYDNVLVAAVGAKVVDAPTAARASLERVGLLDAAGRSLSTLTVAETKFLELARAIVADPALLLLDEPLAGLNESERRRFFATVDEVVGPETAVVVIEHSVRSLVDFADRLIALEGGVIIASGPPHEVIADERVITAYLGERWRAHVGRS